MSPFTASLGYAGLALGLLAFNRQRSLRTSPALWLPTIWLAIGASRPISFWLGVGPSARSPEQYLEGSPFDRALLTGLVLLSIGVLFQRQQRVAAILRANRPVLPFVLYCALSIAWSDFPDVALKRWVKWLGALTMMLIVLTEDDIPAAVKRLLSRVGFVLVPWSVVLIKYYPDLGRGYNRFTWTPYYQGVATGKNELGIICLIFGIGTVWRVLQLLDERKIPTSRKPLIAHVTFLALVLWLFQMANSMTSLSCFLMASALMVSTKLRSFRRRRWAIPALTVALLGIALSALFLQIGSGLVESLGRDPTLTGRTEVWKSVFPLAGNPLLGTGFESFWLGHRLEELWRIHWWHPNEAHSGYIELYLTIGWIGIFLYSQILIPSWQRVMSAVHQRPEEGRLRLAFFFVGVAYNFTESAVGSMHPVWMLLLLAAVQVPGGWVNSRQAEMTTFRHPSFVSAALLGAAPGVHN